MKITKNGVIVNINNYLELEHVVGILDEYTKRIEAKAKPFLLLKVVYIISYYETYVSYDFVSTESGSIMIVVVVVVIEWKWGR